MVVRHRDSIAVEGARPPENVCGEWKAGGMDPSSWPGHVIARPTM